MALIITGLILLSYATVVEAIILKGQVKSELKTELKSYSIKVNDSEFNFKNSGKFELDVPVSRLYQMTINVEGHYSSYQTFSHYELADSETTANNQIFSIPDISLVAKKAKRVMFAFGGDVMMARRYTKPYFSEPILINEESKAQDTKALIQHMKPYMELADFSAVNLETQITDHKPTQRAPKSVTFYSPPETLAAIEWAGVDYVTLGNNHIFDYLDEGLISTLKYLDDSNLAYSGAGMDQKQALLPHYQQFPEQQYAMLGFVGWKGNFTPHQAAGPGKGGSALGTKDNIVSTVSAASKLGMPTIVQYHGSLEYSEEPSRMTQSRLKTAVDHGADLVIAHHPHVTQGFELYKGKLIAYSMGNFIFDQYFHASPLSYVLYVWMDTDKFHRAEIVPIYLKGYVPVPATGMQRNALTKRTRTLSQRRGISFTTSGGHLVLDDAKQELANSQQKIIFKSGETVKNIYMFPESGHIKKVSFSDNNIGYRLGENLLNAGDFENYDLFTSDERSWLLKAANLTNTVAHSGTNSIAVRIKDKTVATIGMKTFRRVFNHANPMTYQAKILNNGQRVRAKLYMQLRGKNDKFFDALKNGRKTLLKDMIIESDVQWQNIQFDFNTPRVGYKSYRIYLELSADTTNTNTGDIYLDDISLVQWQAHYNEANKLPADVSIRGLATHLGLETEADDDIEIMVQYK